MGTDSTCLTFIVVAKTRLYEVRMVHPLREKPFMHWYLSAVVRCALIDTLDE